MLRGDAERHMGLANRAYLQGDLVSAKFYAYNVLALGTRTVQYCTIEICYCIFLNANALRECRELFS